MQERLRVYVFFAAACFLLLCTPSLQAQNLGSIVGRVTDPTGGVIPGATVKVTRQETEVSRTYVTDETGTYLAPALNVGTYTVEVTMTGFKAYRRADIVLNVRDQLRVDIQLELGNVAETVEVTGRAVTLQTETAAVEQVVSGAQVQNIAMNGRNFLQLPALVPGASSTQPAFNTPVGVSANAGINFNGLRSSQNVWRVDGQENYDRGCGGCIEVLPSIDAIAEFKVGTANSDVDLGFGSAGQVNVAIKSGTRDFHGTLYEFLRNDAMDANNFFRNLSGGKKPKLRLNNFGYNVGGPVILPGYNKERNKTFFFWNQEWRKIRSESVYYVPAISAAIRAGDFSGYSKPITDPLTGQPFEGNRIPASRIDPNATILLDPQLAFPLPNTPEGYFSGVGASPLNLHEEILRVDHNIDERNQVFFRFVHDTLAQNQPTTMWGGQSYPTVGTLFTNQPKIYHGQWTSTFSPNIVNEASLSFGRQPLQLAPTGVWKRPSNLNIPELFSDNRDNRMPNISLQGVVGVNIDFASWPWTNNLDTWIVRDNIAWNRGTHTLRFGGEYMHIGKRQDLFGPTQGAFTFNTADTGHEVASFLLGRAFQYQELEVQTSPLYLAQSGSLFINDTWRATPKLTVNVGLRWDALPHAYEAEDRVAVFYPRLYDSTKAPTVLGNGQLVPGSGDLLNGIAQAGKNGIPRGMVQNHWWNIQPRFGIAYRMFGDHTVLRFGWGLFTERIQGNDIYNVGPNPPNSQTAQIYNTSLSNPGGGAAALFPRNLQTYDEAYKLPQVQQYNLGIQQRLAQGVVMSVSYVGSSAAYLQTGRNINQPYPDGAARVLAGTAIVNQVRPYLGWGNINSYENSTSSNYNSLQFSFRTENYRGLTLQTSYTWSHAIDYVSGDVPGNSHQDVYNWHLERASSNFDRTHMLIFNYIYNIPIPASWNKAAQSVLGGWTLSGISSFQTGIPMNISLPGDNAGIGGSFYRPDVAGDPNLPSGSRTRQRYFDPTVFKQPPAGKFGNLGRNVVRQGGVNNWDISIFKAFPLGWESSRFEFRAEMFNAFNHTQWSGYRTGFGSTGFGEANSARDARSVQMGLKLYW
jgi:hypothetical protein